ncbi:helix-turn-helix transcriptional regulator [Methylobacillus flagellatus]|nr:helix-turn-helix transcriptional regulator [Methylobacillus flagellatus]
MKQELMMETVEMLDKCKEKLGVSSDYALAKELDIRQARLTSYRKGREHPDVYVCFRIAEILGESPSSIIAQVEAKNAKNENKALYFKRFFSMAVLWISLVLVLPGFTGSYGTAYAAGNTLETPAVIDFTPHYAKYAKDG